MVVVAGAPVGEADAGGLVDEEEGRVAVPPPRVARWLRLAGADLRGGGGDGLFGWLRMAARSLLQFIGHERRGGGMVGPGKGRSR